MPIQFRPHHFLCALCFKGRGYSSAFVANFQAIVAQLNTQSVTENTPIEVVSETDSICHPCPHRQEKHCETEAKINTLDHKHSEALGFEPGTQFTWEQAKQQLQNKLTLNTFHDICADCQWKPLGICEKVIMEFLQNP